MGLTELPNGITYFSLSEELKIWVEIVYEIFTPINLGIFTIITVMAVALVIIITFVTAKKQIESAL